MITFAKLKPESAFWCHFYSFFLFFFIHLHGQKVPFQIC